MIAQGVEAHLLADGLEHTPPPLRGGVGVLRQVLLSRVPLQGLGSTMENSHSAAYAAAGVDITAGYEGVRLMMGGQAERM